MDKQKSVKETFKTFKFFGWIFFLGSFILGLSNTINRKLALKLVIFSGIFMIVLVLLESFFIKEEEEDEKRINP